jgi:hypothetical protein
LGKRLGEFRSWAAARFGRNRQPVLGFELCPYCVRKIICGVLYCVLEELGKLFVVYCIEFWRNWENYLWCTVLSFGRTGKIIYGVLY